VQCKAAYGNFFAGVLAIASIVAYERAGQPVYRTVIPFHTRSEEQWATSLGWYIGLAPIEIATARARDFHELVGMAHEAVRKAKPMAQVPFAKVCRLMETAVRPVSVISYMDGQMVPGAHQWRDWKAHGFGKVSYGDDAYLWVNRTVDGLFVTSRYPSTDVGHKNMSAFIERTREVLTLVARSGGHRFEGDVALERAVA
jgi:mycolipenoyl-CoA---2-(long-chain-fatty acyl)-trehalose mycolipenoyltransferase / long-chain-acyl-CoA---trehalose acyltransferase